MNPIRHFLSVRMAIAGIVSVGLASLATAEMRIGVAAVDISPPIGAPMAGYYSARGCTGQLDPLHASAMVIEYDSQRAALVALDLITTTTELVDEVREQVTAQTGIPADAVMISASHTHTGPSIRLTGRDAEQLAQASPEVKRYHRELPSKISSAVRQAVDDLSVAKLEAAIGSAAGLAFCRRFHMIDGSVGWNPPKLSPKIVRPVGPTDDDVPTVLVRSADGAIRAVYLNFAMHLDTVSGTSVSADYPGVTAGLLRRATGDELITLFTIGCAGDINHRDVQWADRQKGIDEATRIGTHLASAALHAIRQARPVSEGRLQFARRQVPLRPSPHQPGDVPWAKLTQERKQSGQSVPFLDQVRAGRISDVEALQGSAILAEVQVITLGNELAWVSLPGEIFVELGLAIKQASPFKHTIIAELANGSVGYVPTRAAYAQGNYEVISARVGEGSGERLVEAALDLLQSLH